MAITRWFLVSSACVALIGSAAAQNMASGSVVGRVGRPRVFPQGVPSVQVAVSAGTSVAQLSEANFRLASNEETEGMELTLEKYEGAFESLSLQQVRQIWPALDRQHEGAFKNVFEAFRQTSWSRSLRLECATPKVSADTANVVCQQTLRYGAVKGKPKQLGPVRVAILLRKQSGGWVVGDMKGLD